MNRQSAKFTSDNERLCKGFEWAKAQAEAFVRDEALGGPCYEASLPGRDSFCMRDYSHQSVGAHCLGLFEHNKNMMRAFTDGISESKDWCTFWEITSEGKPTPVDYTSDSDFWYNLPSNFDIMDTASRLYDLTGDSGYILSPSAVNFFKITLEKYIPKWDRDGDGIVDRVDSDGRRGIASYEEAGTTGYASASDALALEYSAFIAAARMFSLKDDLEKAADCLKKAKRLHDIFTNEWWFSKEQRFYEFRNADGSFNPKRSDGNLMTPLRTGIITDSRQIEGQFRSLMEFEEAMIVEIRSYMPMLLWKYGKDDEAMRVWLKMTDENYQRREYPEVSYAAIEALLCGYMGISANFDRRVLKTRSACSETSRVTCFPLWNGSVDVCHEKREKTVITNRSGYDLTWVAEFPSGTKTITVEKGKTAELRA